MKRLLEARLRFLPLSGVTLAIGPLQDNGGPTLTHAPLPGSQALDSGSDALATNAGLTTDQRGASTVADQR